MRSFAKRSTVIVTGASKAGKTSIITQWFWNGSTGSKENIVESFTKNEFGTTFENVDVIEMDIDHDFFRPPPSVQSLVFVVSVENCLVNDCQRRIKDKIKKALQFVECLMKEDVPLVILFNKCDLLRVTDYSSVADRKKWSRAKSNVMNLQNWAQNLGFQWFQTSVKDDINILECFHTILVLVGSKRNENGLFRQLFIPEKRIVMEYEKKQSFCVIL